jgi:GT2 family glycosyltransferase
MTKALSIVIVNYRSADLVIDCIKSIHRFDQQLECEIIVVDNYSKDDSKQKILLVDPLVHWIQMDHNAGFARANNAGIRESKAAVVLLLNPDTLAIDDSISKCLKEFQNSDYVACGVQLLNSDNTPQISGNFFMKGGLNHLLPLPYWGKLLRWLALMMKTQKTNVPEAKGLVEVDWISGAFLMVKKNAIDKAGLMDEDFFLYAEEVEWCSRLNQIGKLCIYGQFHFIHLQGEAINKAHDSKEKGYYNLYDRKGLQLMVSNHVRVRKQYGEGWFLFLLLNYTWGVLVYFIMSFLDRLVTFRNPFVEWSKCFACAKNVFYVWKLFFVIMRNKPHFYKIL